MITQKEQQTVEIFTTEQLDILPANVKDSVVFLTDNLPSKELMVLNPLVSELIKIMELKTLEYVPGDKASTEAYKAALKDITTFDKSVPEAKTAIKKPLDLIGKEVLAIEKGIKSVSAEVKETLALTFAEFEKQEEDRKAKAKAKREEKHTAAIEELAGVSAEQTAQIAKNNAINRIKYELPDEVHTSVVNAVANFGVEALQAKRNEVNSILELNQINQLWPDFEAAGTLTVEEFNAAALIHNEKIKSYLATIDDKLALLTVKNDNQLKDARQDAIASFGGFAVGVTPVAAALAIEPEKFTNTSAESIAQIEDDDFTIIRNPNGSVNLSEEIKSIVEQLELLKNDTTIVYDEARTFNLNEEEVTKLKKLSGTCILLQKIIDYINQ